MSRSLEKLHCPDCNGLLPSRVVRLSAPFTCPHCGAGLTVGSAYGFFGLWSSALIAAVACHFTGGSIVALLPLWFVIFSFLCMTSALILRQFANPHIRFSDEHLSKDDPK
jgi:hypothetical protein